MAVYACSDLHGNMKLYNQIKLFLDPEDKVYFLGDANDRGKYGWELIKTIYNDPQFIYLRGNHEDMFIAAALDSLKTRGKTDNITMLFQNGGAKTLSGFAKDGRPLEWLDKIMKLPTHAEYENENGQIILMSHAGYTPKLEGENIILPCDDDLLWGRDHIFDEWDYESFEDYIVVHGHTPTVYLASDLNYPDEEVPLGPLWYDNHHKVGIDNACYFTGAVCLLDLDLLEAVVIKI